MLQGVAKVFYLRVDQSTAFTIGQTVEFLKHLNMERQFACCDTRQHMYVSKRFIKQRIRKKIRSLI